MQDMFRTEVEFESTLEDRIIASFFLDFLWELYKLRFQSGDMVKSFPTLSKEVNIDMENSD
jgi:hypothetical protein